MEHQPIKIKFNLSAIKPWFWSILSFFFLKITKLTISRIKFVLKEKKTHEIHNCQQKSYKKQQK